MAHRGRENAAEPRFTPSLEQSALPADTTPGNAPDLARLALLIADGSLPFPSDWDVLAAGQLAAEVVRIRRTRLIRFIARAIATSIRRDSASNEEVGLENEE